MNLPNIKMDEKRLVQLKQMEVQAVKNEESIFREFKNNEDYRRVMGGSEIYEDIRARITNVAPNDRIVGRDEQDCEKQRGSTLNSSIFATPKVIDTIENKDQNEKESIPSGVSYSTRMSQIALLPEDVSIDQNLLPDNLTDINGSQLDLRTHNSWLLKLEEVSTPEVVETMFINAISPFVLNSRLKPLMISGGETRPDRYIINVSAMEGKFYRYKTPNHPHTNMAKAALNMMTRTSAEDLAKKSRIYMNSVDTGLINDENPLERASKTAERNHFQTPIDEVDAAARILDPVFTGVNTGKQVYGLFLKDYRESEW